MKERKKKWFRKKFMKKKFYRSKKLKNFLLNQMIVQESEENLKNDADKLISKKNLILKEIKFEFNKWEVNNGTDLGFEIGKLR
jgi:hypothetical protein